jgi:hypothetical protein
MQIPDQSILYFGLLNFALALIFLALTQLSSVNFGGTSAWFKPFKFALSICAYSLTIVWLTSYLSPSLSLVVFNWSVIVCLGFEILYITIQAGKGQASHFNLSSSLHAAMYALMAGAATAVSLGTGFIAFRFFTEDFPALSAIELRSIQIGLVLFVIFSLQGFVMGSRLTHTVGGTDGSLGVPILNWSRNHGDLRISHFLGMHALQTMPLLGFFVFTASWQLYLSAGLYTALTVYTLVQALKGKPLFQNRP